MGEALAVFACSGKPLGRVVPSQRANKVAEFWETVLESRGSLDEQSRQSKLLGYTDRSVEFLDPPPNGPIAIFNVAI